MTTEAGRTTVSDPDRFTQYEIYGNAPVQAFGTFLGRDLYFRARHDGWRLDIADEKGNLRSDGAASPDAYYWEGNHDNASYMPFDIAVRIIERCLRELTG